MATSAEPHSPQQYVDFDEYIDFQLQRTRTNIKITDILTAAGGAAVLLLGYLLVFVVFDHWVIAGGFGYAARLLMLGAIVLAVGAWVGWKVVRPYLKSVNRLFAARVIERSEPKFNSTLLNLVDLRRADRDVSPLILTSMEKRAAVTLSHMDVDHAVDRRRLMRVSYALLAIVVLCCLYTLFSPKPISNSIWRALFPMADVSVATRTEIVEVKPGNVNVLAREQLEVIADLKGEAPERITLHFTTTDQRYVDEPIAMRPAEEGVQQYRRLIVPYRGLIAGENGRGILQDMSYHVVAGDDRSEEFQITVIQPPRAKVDEVHYEYPKYMELDPRTQPGGHIDAWEGTNVVIKAKANMPVKSALVLFSDNEDTSAKAEEVRMRIVGGTNLSATWDLKFREDGTYARYYRIQCKNKGGDTDPEPALHSIKIRPDEPPEVVLLDPVRDLQRPANAIVPMAIQAHDPDFKLRSVKLKLQKNGDDLPDIYLFDGTTRGLRQSFSETYDLKLKDLNLKTDDRVTFWIEARDNKEPLENRKNTPKLNIRVVEPVSEEEARKQLEQDKHEQQQKLDELKQDRNQEGIPEPQPPDATEEGNQGEESHPDDQQETTARKQRQPSEKSPEEQASSEDKSPGGAKGKESKGGDQTPEQEPADDQEALRELLKRQQRDVKQDLDENPPKDGRQKDDGSSKGGPQDSAADDKSPKKGKPDHPDDKDGTDSNTGGEDEKKAGKGGSDKGEADGKPSDGATNSSESQPGKENEEDKSKPGSRNANESKEPLDGKEEPAEPSNDARREKASGDERGEATAEKDPNTEATPAKDELKRKEGEEGATRRREEPSDPKDSDANPRKGEKPDAGGEERPSKTASRPKEKSDDRPSNPTDDERKPSLSKRPDGQGDPAGKKPAGKDASDKPSDGKPAEKKESGKPAGKEGDGSKQKSGEKGGDKPGGKKGGDKPGEKKGGEKPGGKKGGDKPGGEKGGDKPGGEKGGGKKGGDKPGGKGKSGEGTAGPKGKKQGKGAESAKTGGGGKRPGAARGGGKDKNGGRGEGGEAGADAAEEANLDYSKKAADLVLKRLEDDLRRGEVDQKLLDRLGWTKEDMQRFADRLRRQLDDPGDDRSAGAVARRRQFEEMLKSLDLQSTQSRRNAKTAGRRPSEGIDVPDLPVPAEYREAYEAFTKSLSKRNRGARD